MAHADRETAAGRSRGALIGALVITGGFLVVEVIGAVWTGSLALAADAGHMLTDVGGLALALFATWVAARPPTPAHLHHRPRPRPRPLWPSSHRPNRPPPPKRPDPHERGSRTACWPRVSVGE